MTALVMSGQAGAAFTAEMGTMKVSDEVLALETMALNPVKFLITPRFLALLITLPCLTIMVDRLEISFKQKKWFEQNIGLTRHAKSTRMGPEWPNGNPNP